MFLLVIADDFTGALDTAVQFTTHGIKAEVVTNNNINFDNYNTDVLVVDAETRHLSAQEAFDIVSNLIKQALKTDVKYIYKKTDSALRGNIGAELEAVMKASLSDRLAFFPAFPQINRITKNGIHYIDGVEVNNSSFGHDPYEPVKYASIKDIIAQQSTIPVCNIKTSDTNINNSGILVFDAQTTNDLISQGENVINKQGIRILAGCAGFAEFLPNLLKIKANLKQEFPKIASKLLVICGSVNPITISQLDYAQNNGFSRIKLSPKQKLSKNYFDTLTGQKLLSQFICTIENSDGCIIESNDDKHSLDTTTSYAKKYNLSTETIRERISTTMGYLAKKIIDQKLSLTMLLTGGDTLLKCLKAASINKLEPICELEKGIVLASFTYLNNKIYVITKSGGFGNEDLLIKLTKFLQAKNIN